MTSERWQHIDRLFHATLECAPEKRAGVLAEACGDDADLRNEVESLLRAHEQDATFLDIPAYELAADFLTDALGGLMAGQQIGPYKILAPLATGGMGEVYLAQDSRLGRKIALKLLPPDFARDQQRVRRFAQEARAASALSHPNVCVIHEVGRTSDGRHFIAMEHIDGITLRERITQGPLSLNETLAMAEQIAAALSAAHVAGVIHRDIKPENIMLRKDGYVKVLDFGLAKLNESQPNAPDINEASTMAHFQTEPGTQMGTVRYMSPEQLRERPVDERTDIWSFGVVLHEMVTGFTPFEARSRAEIMALILKRQPPRLSFSQDVPQEFQQIVAKAMSKDRGRRYPSVNDLAADLKKLRRQILGETTNEPLAEPLAAGKNGVSRSSLESVTRHQRKLAPASNTDRLSSALTYVSHTAEQILTGIKQHPGTTVFAGLTAVFAIILFGLNSRWLRPQPQTSPPFQSIKMTLLTNAGQSVCAAISPDGKSFAHVEQKDGMQELQVTNLANSGISVVVPAGDLEYRGITFSRDANYLYFTTGGRNEAGVLYQVALPGGTPRKIKDGVDSPITFSPTGDRFAFVRFNVSRGEYFMMIAGIDGTGERAIATRQKGERFSLWGPAWSPDGQTIVCGAGKWEQGYHMKLIEVNVETGHETQIGNQQWYFVSQVVWSGDKSELIVSAREQPTSPYQLWRISYPEGEPFSLTTNATDTGFDNVSLSQDGNNIVAVQNQQVSRLWITPDGDYTRAIGSNVGRAYGLDWTSKGKIVFSSMTGKNLNISSVDPDGSNRVQLTVNAGDNYTPATSPDGRLIVFASNRTGSLNIWRMNADDGSDARQLTFSDGNSYPTISPDGQWVVYDCYDNRNEGAWTAWKVPVEGGTPVLLIDRARMPVVSPDNQFIACRTYPEGHSPEIGILSVERGSLIKRLPIPIRDWQRVQWTPDGGALTYIDAVNGVSNIWKYDLADGSKQQLTDFKTDQIFAYAWSPDFKQLASLRGTEVRDVTMITNQNR
jgi:serine/threonine protein kinase/Tol biopolymer transport system component